MEQPKHVALSIVIPVRNEETNLQILVPMLDALVATPHEILVVHDAKDDTSIPAVTSLQDKSHSVRLVYNTLGKGVINAVRSGVSHAKANCITTMAADDIGIPLGIDDMVELLRAGCDLVNGTRYAHGGRNIGGSFISTLLSTISNRMFYLTGRSRLTDPTFGVKTFKKSLFESITLDSNPVGWAWSLEFALKAQNTGAKLGEVPLISLNRLFAGSSSFAALAWLKEYWRWLIWSFRNKGPKQDVRVRVPKKLQK